MNVFQKVFPVGWVLMACLGSSAALATTAQPTPAQDAAQQAALQQQRAQVQAEYAAQRGACLQRFFVNDCLDAAHKKERAALTPIDTDLQAIALRGRLRAAEDELRRVQANMAASQRGQPDRAQAEQQSAAREADLAQRQQQAAQQAAQRAAQAAAAPPKTPATAAAPVPTPAERLFPAPAPQSQMSPAQRAAEIKQAEADFAAKQKTYAEKQAEQARQNAAKPSTAPLPVPPPSAP